MSGARDISASFRICLNVTGNTVRHAYAFGDFDLDKLNEFAIGSLDGNLLIFKDKNCSPRWRASDLGTITALAFGNVCSPDSSDLFVLTVEGYLYTFSQQPTLTCSPDRCGRDCIDIQFSRKQFLYPNARMAIIYDTNRRVRVFQYVPSPSGGTRDRDESVRGKFVTIAHWTLDGQVGTICINLGEHGRKQLLASQPGAAFISLNLAATTEPSTDFPDVFYNPVGLVPARTSTNAFTEIVGMLNPERPEGLGTKMCICTSDGLVMLMNSVDKIIWTEYLESRIIALDKLNLVSQEDKTCDILACCEDGVLYILRENKDMYRLNFGVRVENFCAGEYGMDGKNIPVLSLFSFRNRVLIYYNVGLACQPPVDMISLLHSPANKDLLEAVTKRVEGECTREKMAEVIHKLLYGTSTKAEQHSEPKTDPKEPN